MGLFEDYGKEKKKKPLFEAYEETQPKLLDIPKPPENISELIAGPPTEPSFYDYLTDPEIEAAYKEGKGFLPEASRLIRGLGQFAFLSAPSTLIDVAQVPVLAAADLPSQFGLGKSPVHTPEGEPKHLDLPYSMLGIWDEPYQQFGKEKLFEGTRYETPMPPSIHLLKPEITKEFIEWPSYLIPTVVDEPVYNWLKENKIIAPDVTPRTFQEEWERNPAQVILDLAAAFTWGATAGVKMSARVASAARASQIAADMTRTGRTAEAMEFLKWVQTVGLDDAIKLVPGAVESSVPKTAGQKIAQKVVDFEKAERAAVQVGSRIIKRKYDPNPFYRLIQYGFENLRKIPAVEKGLRATERSLGIGPFQRLSDYSMYAIPERARQKLAPVIKGFEDAARRIPKKECDLFVDVLEGTLRAEKGALIDKGFKVQWSSAANEAYTQWQNVLKELDKYYKKHGFDPDKYIARFNERAKARFIDAQMAKGASYEKAAVNWASLDEPARQTLRDMEWGDFHGKYKKAEPPEITPVIEEIQIKPEKPPQLVENEEVINLPYSATNQKKGLVERGIYDLEYFPQVLETRPKEYAGGLIPVKKGLRIKKVDMPQLKRRKGVIPYKRDPEVAGRVLTKRLELFETTEMTKSHLDDFRLMDDIAGAPVTISMANIKKGRAPKLPEGWEFCWDNKGRPVIKRPGETVPEVYGLYYPQGWKIVGDMEVNAAKIMRDELISNPDMDIADAVWKAVNGTLGDMQRVKEIANATDSVYLIPEYLLDRYGKHLHPSRRPQGLYADWRSMWVDGILTGLHGGRWQLNNLVGNLMMSVLDNSIWNIPATVKRRIAGQIQDGISADLIGGGLMPAVRGRESRIWKTLIEKPVAGPLVAKPLKGWSDSLYKMNEFWDAVTRESAVMKRLKPLIEKQRRINNYKQTGTFALDNLGNLTDREVNGLIKQIFRENPALADQMGMELQSSIYNFAVRSPLEKYIATRTHFFMPWIKFTYMWVGNMAIKAPYKLAMMAKLSEITQEITDAEWDNYFITMDMRDEGGNLYTAEDLPIDVRSWAPLKFDPKTGEVVSLAVMGGNPLWEFGQADYLVSGLNPLIQAGFKGAAGLDLYKVAKMQGPYAEAFSGDIPEEYLDQNALNQVQGRLQAMFTGVVPYGSSAEYFYQMARPYGEYPTKSITQQPLPYKRAGEEEPAYKFSNNPLVWIGKLFGIGIRELEQADIIKKIERKERGYAEVAIREARYKAD